MAEEEEIENQPKIEKVMPALLELEKDNKDYLPAVVSFGPYHHGHDKLAFMEKFKPTAVELFVSSGENDKKFYHDKILRIIPKLRSCYEETSKVEEYSDDELAQMMLQDAALLIIYMEIVTADRTKKPDDLMQEKYDSLVGYLGMLTYEVLQRDMVLLENQIPLRVITELVDERDGKGRGGELVGRSLMLIFFGEHVKEASFEHNFRNSPHLLDVIRGLHIFGPGFGKPNGQVDKTASQTNRCMDLENGLGLRKLLGCKSGGAADADKHSLKRFIPVYRAATDLKAKGIHFKPSPTQALTDVTFKFHFLYARLRIPAFTVETMTKVLFKNMIAYEMSPNNLSKCEIASFISFIKSLIEKAQDLKELREKKILFNKLESDEEVLSMLKDMKTHGVNFASIYEDVRKQIGTHCDTKMRTWIAELLHTHFESPWAAFAFSAAVVLLGVTVAQLYFAAYPN